MGTVYLLHFSSPFHHARHYLGWTTHLSTRLWLHRRGQAAKLLRAVKDAGIDWNLVRVWEDSPRRLERQLKRWHGSGPLCPVCRGEADESFDLSPCIVAGRVCDPAAMPF